VEIERTKSQDMDGTITDKEAEEYLAKVLKYLNEDPKREGLVETPKRYLKFMKEFLSPPDFKYTSFENEGTDDMIVQKNIPFFSLCEHHIAPFFGVAHVAYIPNGKIVGLSKLARTVETYSRRLQNQERITQQIAERLMDELNAKGVAVVMEAEHLCMAMRGVKKHGVTTTTSKMMGIFFDESKTRNEFMQLIK
jgi:GTP cyclohydrolase I